MPALRHGIARIDRQVDQNLFHLPAIDFNETKVVTVNEFKLDIHPDETPQQVRDLGKNIGDVLHLWAQRLLA